MPIKKYTKKLFMFVQFVNIHIMVNVIYSNQLEEVQNFTATKTKHYKGVFIMTNAELTKALDELNELKKLEEEVEMAIKNLEDKIKNEMNKQNTEEMVVGRYIIRYTTVISDRFDTSSFKKVQPDVYQQYIKQSISRRFSIK